MGRIGTIINRKGKQDAKKRQGVYKNWALYYGGRT